MTHIIYIHTTRHDLDASQLIQSGGEGMVFGLDATTAVKLYHQPTPQRVAKLHTLLDGPLAGQLPPGVLGPCAPVTNRQGDLIGFAMPRLAPGSLPFKKLSSPPYWQKAAMTTAVALNLLRQAHATLSALHRLGLVVGDLNDHNLHFLNGAGASTTVAWIDVDSYQVGSHPCPVALPAFLDPRLYHVADFSRQPVFTPVSDWYAFAVLLVKTLLQVHPYGGVHHRHKTLPDRATNRISVLDSSVTYPLSARPPETLSDDLLAYVGATFGQGVRQPLPLVLLDAYARSLTTCPDCGLAYPQHRRACPGCRRQTAVSRPHPVAKTLLTVDGWIEHVSLRPDGRLHVLLREGHTYKRVRLGLSGVVDEMVLFEGQPGYRLTACHANGHDLVAINPPGRADLLILDLSDGQPRQLACLETGWFRDTAVFAATPHALYRLAGAWIMRGTVQHGHYVEEPIATAHKNQTIFWAPPYGDTLAGLHRIFAEHRFFLWHAGSSYDVPLPTATARETAVGFGPRAALFALQTDHAVTHWHEVGLDGKLISSGVSSDPAQTIARCYPLTPHQLPPDLNPAGIIHLYRHHGHTLARHAQQLTRL